MRGDPLLVSQVWSSFPVLAEKGSHLSRIATSRLPTHIPDFTAVEGDLRDDFWGFRTSLFVPLLKDNEIVGMISLGRKQVQPFTDKQISLFRDFAAQATIALESTLRERQYREAQMALAHANRVAMMGQLTASITHEVNQPITAAVTYALAARRFLSADPLNFREVDDALSLIVKEGNRAGEVVERVRALIKKVPARKDAVAIDDAILEVIALTRTEAANNSVSVRTQFAEGLPRVQGDRVQLQQVMLNLIVNAIQSMRSVEDGNRELHISTVSIEPKGVCVAVRDTGHGLRPESLPRSLNPSTRRSPTAWAWASRSAARSSKPMLGGCGRPGASREVLSFSLRSPLTEPPSTRRKSRLLTNGGCQVHGLVRLRIISNKTAGSYKERTRRLHQIRVQKASISASGLDLRQTRICRDRTQSVGFSYRGGDRRLWGSNRRNSLVAFPSATKCLVEGD